ncbi:MAG TPA: PIN domain-containing protein [Candidatus Hydrogenedentes bacterium]|nr:PIN domain-containing protein [Candidatus Hydrogenedentota bacterium]
MRLFADTSFYVAIVSPKDVSHTTVMDIIKQYKGRIITTEYVLVEVGNWLASSGDRGAFIKLNQQIKSDPKTLVVPAESALYDAGVNLYAHRPDKEWSLTDCISFAVMRQFGLMNALTADHHFQQAGFTSMLR